MSMITTFLSGFAYICFREPIRPVVYIFALSKSDLLIIKMDELDHIHTIAILYHLNSGEVNMQASLYRGSPLCLT